MKRYVLNLINKLLVIGQNSKLTNNKISLRMTYGIATTFIVLSITYSAKAQPNLASFPSPEAAELGKYGQVPVSYFNGLPEIAIPIYTVKCKDIDLPISLSYYASGNKPDQHPSWVGLGWNLNCGGMITRIVNTLRDEMNTYDCLKETGIGSSKDPGYFYRADELSGDNWYTDLLPKLIGDDYSYYTLDPEPDEFMFNFCGHSGSFWFVYENGGMQVKVKSKDGEIIKVEPILFPGTVDYPIFEDAPSKDMYKFEIYKTFQKFKVTTRDGFIYDFGGDISNIDFTTNNGIAVSSSWHLTKITSPLGSYINLEYKKGGDVVIQNKSKYFNETHSPQDNSNFCYLSRNTDNDGYSLTMINPKYLSKIVTSTGQTLNFITAKSIELGYNWSGFYSRYSAICDGLVKNVDFIDRFQWNSDLEKVNYYLKLDRIEIEDLKNINFFYSNSATQRLRLSGLSTTPKNSIPQNINDVANQQKYTFGYNTSFLPDYNSCQTDNWGYYNGKDFFSVDYSGLYNFRSADLTFCKSEVLEKITYPTGGATEFDYELNQYSRRVKGLELNNQSFTLSNEEGFGGGLRIKKITQFYDPSDLTKKLIKTYLYKNTDGSSSGILSGKPVYLLEGKKHVEYHISDWSGLFHWAANANYDMIYSFRSQHLLLPLSTTNGNHVTYSRVTEQESDGSNTVYTYTNHDEYPDEEPLHVDSNIDEILLNSFTSKELERGLLKNVSTYNSNHDLVKEVEFKYNDEPNRYNNFVRTINKYFISGCNVLLHRTSACKIYTFYPYLKSKKETVYDTSGNNPVSQTFDYYYNSSNNLLTRKSTLRSDDVSVVTQTKYPTDINTGNYSSMGDLNMLNYPIEETTSVNNNVTSSKLTTYKINGSGYVPDQVYSLEIATPLAGSSFAYFNGSTKDTHYGQTPEYSFDSYDTGNGNPLKVLGKNGIYTYYIWAYNKTYPVAKIETSNNSISISQLQSSVDALTLSLSQDKTLIDSDIQKIKTAINSGITGNDQVTIFTYKPLVGMTSQTDPAGRTTYYEYDDFGRLKLTKDLAGNILKKYEYHYAGQ